MTKYFKENQIDSKKEKIKRSKLKKFKDFNEKSTKKKHSNRSYDKFNALEIFNKLYNEDD